MKRITQLLVVAAMMISALPASVQAQNTEEIKVYPSKDLQLRLGNSNQGGTGSAIEVRENTANNHEYGFCGIIDGMLFCYNVAIVLCRQTTFNHSLRP